MYIRRGFTSLAILFCATSIVAAQQIGPEIRIGGGEATIGGVGVRNGGVVVPTLDQAIDTAINSTPFAVLSDADKANIHNAIKTTGFVLAVASDPITGIVLIKVLSGNGKEQDVPVPTVDAPPSGKNWTLMPKCIVQQSGGLITAMFSDDPIDISGPGPGDILSLSAGVCPEYKDKSVTSVKVKMTGRSDYPNAKPPLYKHYFVGNAS